MNQVPRTWAKQCEQTLDWIAHLNQGRAQFASILPPEEWQDLLDRCLRDFQYRAEAILDRLRLHTHYRNLPEWNWANLKDNLQRLLAFLEQEPWREWVYPSRRERLQELLRRAQEEEIAQQKKLQQILDATERWKAVLRNPQQLRTPDLSPPVEWLKQTLGQPFSRWSDVRQALSDFRTTVSHWARLAKHQDWHNEAQWLRDWSRNEDLLQAFWAWIGLLEDFQQIQKSEKQTIVTLRKLKQNLQSILSGIPWEELPEDYRLLRSIPQYRAALEDWLEELQQAVEQSEALERTVSQQVEQAFGYLQEFERSRDLVRGIEGVESLATALQDILALQKTQGSLIALRLFDPALGQVQERNLDSWLREYRRQTATHLSQVLAKYKDVIKDATKRKSPQEAWQACVRVKDMEVWRQREAFALTEVNPTLKSESESFEKLCEEVARLVQEFEQYKQILLEAEQACREGRYLDAWSHLERVRREGYLWFRESPDEEIPPLEQQWLEVRTGCIARLQKHLGHLEKSLHQMWEEGRWGTFRDLWREWEEIVSWAQEALPQDEQEELQLSARIAPWRERRELLREFDELRVQLEIESDPARRWAAIQNFEQRLQDQLSLSRMQSSQYLRRWLEEETYERYRIAARQAEELRAFCELLQDHRKASLDRLRQLWISQRRTYEGFARQRWRDETLQRQWERECQPLWQLIELRVQLYDLLEKLKINEHAFVRTFFPEVQQKYNHFFQRKDRAPDMAPELEEEVLRTWQEVQTWLAREQEAQKAWEDLQALEQSASPNDLRRAYWLCKTYKDQISSFQPRFRQRFFDLQERYQRALEAQLNQIYNELKQRHGKEREKIIGQLRALLEEHREAFPAREDIRKSFAPVVHEFEASRALEEARSHRVGISINDWVNLDALSPEEVDEAIAAWKKTVTHFEHLQAVLDGETFDKTHRTHLMEARRFLAFAQITKDLLEQRLALPEGNLWEYALQRLIEQYDDADPDWREARVFVLVRLAAHKLFTWPFREENKQDLRRYLREASDYLNRDAELFKKYYADVEGLKLSLEEIERLFIYFNRIKQGELSNPFFAVEDIKCSLQKIQERIPPKWIGMFEEWSRKWKNALLRHLELYWLGRKGSYEERLIAAVIGAGLDLRPRSSFYSVFYRGLQNLYFALKDETEDILSNLGSPPVASAPDAQDSDQQSAHLVERAQQEIDKQLARMEQLSRAWSFLDETLRYAVRLFFKKEKDNEYEKPASEERFVPAHQIRHYQSRLEKERHQLRAFRNRLHHIVRRAYQSIRVQGRVAEVREALFSSPPTPGLRHHFYFSAVENQIRVYESERKEMERVYLHLSWLLWAIDKWGHFMARYRGTLNVIDPETRKQFFLRAERRKEIWGYWLDSATQAWQEGELDLANLPSPALPEYTSWLSSREERDRWRSDFLQSLDSQWLRPSEGRYLWGAVEHYWEKWQELAPKEVWRRFYFQIEGRVVSSEGFKALMPEVEFELCELALFWDFPKPDFCPGKDSRGSADADLQAFALLRRLETLYRDLNQQPRYEYRQRVQIMGEIWKQLQNLDSLHQSWKQFAETRDTILAKGLAQWAHRVSSLVYHDFSQQWEEKLRTEKQILSHAQRAKEHLQDALSRYWEERERPFLFKRKKRLEQRRVELLSAFQEARKYWEGSPWWNHILRANIEIWPEIGLDRGE